MQITSQIEGVTRSVPRHPGTADLFHTRYDFTAIESPLLASRRYITVVASRGAKSTRSSEDFEAN